MTNNDIFKKLRVALQLRDDQIISILELVDFRVSKSELSAFFRDEKHSNYMECGDQVLRNFLNGLVIYLRGTKEAPKDPKVVLQQHVAKSFQNLEQKTKKETTFKPKTLQKKTPKIFEKQNFKKTKPAIQVVEKVKFNNGKNKK